MSGAIFRGSRSAASNPSIMQFRSVELPVPRHNTHKNLCQYDECMGKGSSVCFLQNAGVVSKLAREGRRDVRVVPLRSGS